MKHAIRLSTIIIGALLCMAQALYVLPALSKFEAHTNPEMVQLKMQIEYRNSQYDQKLNKNIAVVEPILKKYHCATDTVKLIVQYSMIEKLPVRLVAAVVAVESSCKPSAMSNSRICIGLMQVNKSVWHYTTSELLQPEQNISAGTSILALYIRRYGLYDGTRHYFGVTDGSEASNLYADKVLKQAGIKS